MLIASLTLRVIRRGVVIVLPMVAGMLATTSLAQTSVSHVQGVTSVPAQPKTVVVFDLAVLDTLQALGVEARGVPSTAFPPQLAKYAGNQYIRVGSLFEPNYEAVNAAKPDLIIIAGRSAPKYTELSKLAPTIDLTVDAKDTVNGVYKNVRTLGRIFNKQTEAEVLVTSAQGSVAALKERARSAGNGLVVLTTGGRLSAYGPGARFGAILHDGLGIPAARAPLKESTHGQAISFEFILDANPDWLFVIDRDSAIGRQGEAAQRLLDNELVRQTTAWKKQQVVYLDPINWYGLGSNGIGALQSNITQIANAYQRAGVAAKP